MNAKSKVVGGWLFCWRSPWRRQLSLRKRRRKSKSGKVSGDIGLLDTEKNYMIVVTKDGKLVTIDYTQKTKVTELKETPAKMSDIGLGSSAVAEYTTKGEKNFLSKTGVHPRRRANNLRQLRIMSISRSGLAITHSCFFLTGSSLRF